MKLTKGPYTFTCEEKKSIRGRHSQKMSEFHGSEGVTLGEIA